THRIAGNRSGKPGPTRCEGTVAHSPGFHVLRPGSVWQKGTVRSAETTLRRCRDRMDTAPLCVPLRISYRCTGDHGRTLQHLYVSRHTPSARFHPYANVDAERHHTPENRRATQPYPIHRTWHCHSYNAHHGSPGRDRGRL